MSSTNLSAPSLDEIWKDSLSIGGFYHRAGAFYTRMEMELYTNGRFDASKKFTSARRVMESSGQEIMIESQPDGEYIVLFNNFFETPESAREFTDALLTLCPGIKMFNDDLQI